MEPIILSILIASIINLVFTIFDKMTKSHCFIDIEKSSKDNNKDANS